MVVAIAIGWRLYLIEILHQTTTPPRALLLTLWLYLIEILHQTTTARILILETQRLYLIEILHQTTTSPRYIFRVQGCILSKFYIKPQLVARVAIYNVVVSYRNSTSNHNEKTGKIKKVNVVSYRNSTSNHNHYIEHLFRREVVSYRNSTSNHNSPLGYCAPVALYLIEILHQTTTAQLFQCPVFQLYLIEILHQTTTAYPTYRDYLLLYLIEILHQTTTRRATILSTYCCILSKFYIKPQLFVLRFRSCMVVSYRNSTSNHNAVGNLTSQSELYLIEILHQTTTNANVTKKNKSCILSKFYIKPQQRESHENANVVVSYRNSTSNHNGAWETVPIYKLYLIEILHQTTTSGLILIDKVLLTGCLPL